MRITNFIDVLDHAVVELAEQPTYKALRTATSILSKVRKRN